MAVSIVEQKVSAEVQNILQQKYDKISIIIPAHDEAKSITRFLEEIFRVVDALNLDCEVIVVDDGSSDDTFQTVLNFAQRNPRIIAVRNPSNMGKGQAIKQGFIFSTGEIVSYIDPDLPISPQRFRSYLRMLEHADVVITSKRHPQSHITYPLHRRILSRCFNWLVRLTLRLPFSDTQCGFKFFKRSVLKEAIPQLLVKRYAFDVELLVNACKRGFRVVEAPITFQHGENTINIRDIFRMGTDLLSIFYRYYFTHTYE